MTQARETRNTDTPRRPRPKRSYAPGEDRRERILASAIENFARFGYSDTSLARIAGDAGVTDAGLIHHFRTKKELFLTVVELRENPYRNVAIEDAETVHDFFGRWVRAVREDAARPEYVRFRAMLSGEGLREGHPARERLKQNLAGALTVFTPILQRGIESGELLPNADPKQTVLELLALNEGLRDQSVTLPEVVDFVRAFEHAADRLLSQITADGTGLN